MSDNLTDDEARAFQEEADQELTPDCMPRETQKTRRRVGPPRRFDQTQLHEDHHGKYVHRDYAAHFFRWGWVSRQIRQGDNVLDIGCGQDQPLAKVLSGRPGGNREHYVGVDLNKITKKFHAGWCRVIDEFNFIERHKELIGTDHVPDGFDRIVCLEVIEHMGVEDGRRMLQAMQDVIVTDGTLYLSTPVFNGLAAANHIHEYRIQELEQLLNETGWFSERRIGTFASMNEIKPVLDEHELRVFNYLRDWFGNDVMATIFASNHPDQSRNNLWVCRPI